jgi:hypothetical protein
MRVVPPVGSRQSANQPAASYELHTESLDGLETDLPEEAPITDEQSYQLDDDWGSWPKDCEGGGYEE